jgi:uncharacterized delta-60 repeat protein
MGLRIFICACLLLAFTYEAGAACETDIPGDVTGDCKVNFDDLAVLAADWLKTHVALEWPARYNGPGNDTDQPQSAAVDSETNFYVTGPSYGSGTDYDYATIKYSPDSNQPVWAARYNGPVDGRDESYAIVIDANDNIYVTGGSAGDTAASDYTTIKYRPDSNEPIWVARYNGAGNANDIAYDAAVDSEGNIYVTGESDGIGGNVDCTTVKYSPDSNQPVWVARYDGLGSAIDVGYGVAIDSNDDIYVVGAGMGAGTSFDYITIKYSPDSNEPVWVARYNGPANAEDESYAIVIDTTDNIYVTGHSTGEASASDYTTIKYRPDSNVPLWVARYNGQGNAYDIAYDVRTDSEGNVYVTGESDGNEGNVAFATIKYSPDSNEPVWVARYDGQADATDVAYTIDVDSNDNIYVTGDSFTSTTEVDYITIKYSPESNEPVWVANYPTLVDENIDISRGRAMAVDSNDNIYIVAGDAVSGTFTDFLTLRHSADFPDAAYIAGDLDNNNRVDFGDLAILADHWFESSSVVPDTPVQPGRPLTSTRSPHVSTREPLTSTRRPHVSTREPFVPTREPRTPGSSGP